MGKTKDWLELGSLITILIFSSLLIFKIKKLENQIYILGQGIPAPEFLKKATDQELVLLYVLNPSKCVGSILEYRNLLHLPETRIVPVSQNKDLIDKWLMSMRINKNKTLIIPQIEDLLNIYGYCRFPVKIIIYRNRIFLWECGATETGESVIKMLKLLKKEAA